MGYKSAWKWLSLLLISLLLAGCTIRPADIVNERLATDEHFTVQSVRYGDDPRHTMDVYVPVDYNGKIPVVYIYGGAWRFGIARDYKFVGHALTKIGHPVIIPNYRLYPKVRFPAFVHDVAEAIKFVELRSPLFFGKPLERFVISGHSAGAHSAALIMTDDRYLKKAGVRASVAGLIGLAGPYDLTLENPEVAPIFGNTGPFSSQPIDFVKPKLAPSLLLHGRDDSRVLPYHTQTFTEELRKSGNYVDMHIYPGIGHYSVVGGVAASMRGMSRSFKEMKQFLSELEQVHGQ